jgi:hypothetical protein
LTAEIGVHNAYPRVTSLYPLSHWERVRVRASREKYAALTPALSHRERGI